MDKKNNIVIGMLAHVDAGKTTLSEALLYCAGVTRKLGRVDRGDSFLDTDEQEKARGITIFSRQAVFDAGDRHFTLLDTPGHADFSAEMERTLQVLDYAVLVVSGADGIQSHTRTLWRLLEEYRVPAFIFVNKMDQAGTDKAARMEELENVFGSGCVDFTGVAAGPDGGEELTAPSEDTLEKIAVCDEAVLEKYLEESRISRKDAASLIAERKLFPCFFGSALKVEGVSELIEGLRLFTAQADPGEDLGARAFKIIRDQRGDRITFLKISSGILRQGDLIGDEKIRQIRIYNGDKFTLADSAETGTVCAVTGLGSVQAGDGLGCDPGAKEPHLEPVLSYEVILPPMTERNKALECLRRLEEELPELHVNADPATREITVRLMGEVQTEIIKNIMISRWDTIIIFGEPRISYRETIASPVIGIGHFEPLRHYAEVHLLIEPDEPGSGITLGSVCSENMLARNFQRLILAHLKEKVHLGVLTGSPLTDVRITLLAGRASKAHTEGGDFRQATYRAVRQGLMKAVNVLLEPYYSFRLEVPAANVGRALSDMERIQARFSLEGNGVITGLAPVSLMQNYHTEVAAYTGGSGVLTCSFGGYYECRNADDVVAELAYDPESDISNTPDSVFCSHGAGLVVPWYEVEEHMHLEEQGLAGEDESGDDPFEDLSSLYINAEADIRRRREAERRSLGGAALDKELQAIFERTYGKKEPCRNSSAAVIKAPEEYVYKENKKRVNRKEYLLVDGYNVIFSWNDLADLARQNMDSARDKLIDILGDFQGYTGQHVILVFDAYKVKGFKGEISRVKGIDVVFTKEAQTADQYIEKTAHEIGRRYSVTVATSDGTEQVIIRSQGCFLLSSRDLRSEIDRVKTELRDRHIEKAGRATDTVGDHLPEELRTIDDESLS
ncbi:MAG: NYN domain-containing protein [Lachnospiraceae bacterium]|nr:NYN domain-containing protein [Lachnospiraceae bacterium]